MAKKVGNNKVGITCTVEMVPEGGVIRPNREIETEYFIREHYNDQSGKEAKAVSMDGRKALYFIPHGTNVIYYPNKTSI